MQVLQFNDGISPESSEKLSVYFVGVQEYFSFNDIFPTKESSRCYNKDVLQSLYLLLGVNPYLKTCLYWFW